MASYKNVGAIFCILMLLATVVILIGNILDSPLSITINVKSNTSSSPNKEDNGYYEIVGDIDLYSQNGDLVPNCVNSEIYNNNDLSHNIITPPNCNDETLFAADSVSGNIDPSSDSSSGDSSEDTTPPTSNPSNNPSIAPTKNPSIAPTKKPTFPDSIPSTDTDGSDGSDGRRRLKNKSEFRNNFEYYEYIRRALRLSTGTEPKYFNLTAIRNMIIINNNFTQINIPSTKFNESIVNASYLFDNSYIYNIPKASLNLLLKHKNINLQILNKLTNSTNTNSTNTNTKYNFDSNKYSPFCNDISFIERNSDFMFNTKVYLPDPNIDYSRSNCNGFITKSVYDLQEYIYKTQNRNNNNCQQKLYYSPEGFAGVGSQLILMGYNLAYSMLKGYKMVLGYIPNQFVNQSHGSFQQFCNVNKTNELQTVVNWNCFLNPQLICNNYKYEPYKYTNNSIHSLYDFPVDLLLNYDLNLGEIFWHSQMIKYLFKPSPKMNNILNKYKKELNWNKYRNEGIIGVHIRHGDACSKQYQKWTRKCNTLDEYMIYIEKMNKLYGYKNVYIATDDQEIINQINQMELKYGNKYNFLYIDLDRIMYSINGTDNLIDLIQYRNDIDYKRMYIEALIDILMLSECSAFIGTFSSNLSRLAYLLMMANSGGYKPYASLDTAWCLLDKGGFYC